MNNDHPYSAHENRISPRTTTDLRTIVQVIESDDESWKEITSVTTVSRNGAAFALSRPVKVGCLVNLVLPMPPELRAYDTGKKVYPVVGHVQHCCLTTLDGDTFYNVSVGFVGKEPPESFKINPQQSYRISGMSADGLWTITESGGQFKHRSNPRFWISLDVTVTLVQKAHKTITKEKTVTRDVSLSGASVPCSLDAMVGDKVKFACPEINFYAIAFVRNRTEEDGRPPTLHLEFVDAELPLEKVITGDVVVPFDDGEDAEPLTAKAAPTPEPEPPPILSEPGLFEFSQF